MWSAESMVTWMAGPETEIAVGVGDRNRVERTPISCSARCARDQAPSSWVAVLPSPISFEPRAIGARGVGEHSLGRRVS